MSERDQNSDQHAACVQCIWWLEWYRAVRAGTYSQKPHPALSSATSLNLKLISCVAIKVGLV